jgi:integrative and conjugative element protein (TIGR02256 family)
LLAEDAEREMVDLAKRAYPFETGGIMLGVFSDALPWITAIEEVPQRRPQRNRFKIPSGVTHRIVDRYREHDPQTGYIGDWHSHPADASLSSVDRMTLASLVVSRKSRLLAVVRLATEEWAVELWRCRLLSSERCAVVVTGPLIGSDGNENSRRPSGKHRRSSAPV